MIVVGGSLGGSQGAISANSDYQQILSGTAEDGNFTATGAEEAQNGISAPAK